MQRGRERRCRHEEQGAYQHLIAGIVRIVHVPELVFVGPTNGTLEILGEKLALASCTVNGSKDQTQTKMTPTRRASLTRYSRRLLLLLISPTHPSHHTHSLSLSP